MPTMEIGMSIQSDADVRAMRALCKNIEQAIARGDLPSSTVSEIKGAIDETRTRVWASMEAARSGDPGWVQEFWLLRAAEICQSMIDHLDRGDVDPRSERAIQLRRTAEDLVASMASRKLG